MARRNLESVERALELLRTKSGMRGLRFDAQGRARGAVPGLASIFATRISDLEIEVVCRLGDFRLDRMAMRRMLIANSLGDGVGAARLAIDPAGDEPILCRRFEISRYDEETFVEAFREFALYASYWISEGPAELADPMDFGARLVVEDEMAPA